MTHRHNWEGFMDYEDPAMECTDCGQVRYGTPYRMCTIDGCDQFDCEDHPECEKCGMQKDDNGECGCHA